MAIALLLHARQNREAWVIALPNAFPNTPFLSPLSLLCICVMPDINCKDYRPWYGLGQAYEILAMHLYALYYYRRATALRYIAQ